RIYVPVTGVTITNAPSSDLFVNTKGTLTATVSPDYATNKTVTWSSSDPDYVSINATTGEYEVEGTKGYGSATITATATNGTTATSDDKTATCTITGKVTYTSLKVNDVIHVGDTVYATSTIFVKYGNKTNSSINKNLGVYTLVNDGGTYKWTTKGNPVPTQISATSNSYGIYVKSGSGTSNDRFTFAAHTETN
ncbi:MAG: Ig-like domain-containing protein, partial [Synergistaceae bacterium]|nr:Ig-like domain-containing protein [Synergistaceae bacterium]